MDEAHSTLRRKPRRNRHDPTSPAPRHARPRQPPPDPRLVRPRRAGHHPRPAFPRRHLLRQALRQPRDRAGNRRRGTGHGRRRADPPALPALDARRRRLDPHADGRSRERAHAPDDLHRDRAAELARTRAGAGRAGGVLHLLPAAVPRVARAPRTAWSATSRNRPSSATPSTWQEIDAGRVDNVPAPKIALDYWQLPADATPARRGARGARRRSRATATSTTATPSSCARWRHSSAHVAPEDRGEHRCNGYRTVDHAHRPGQRQRPRPAHARRLLPRPLRRERRPAGKARRRVPARPRLLAPQLPSRGSAGDPHRAPRSIRTTRPSRRACGASCTSCRRR